jgi:hypothetical protein
MIPQPVSSTNIIGLASLADEPWHVRHDDEVYTESGEYVGTCWSPADAQRIVRLHNEAHKRGDRQP